MAPKLADLYLRLSDFRADDRDSFPEREDKLRSFAAQLGYGVHDVLIENDIDEATGTRKPASAYKRRKVTLADGSTALRVYRPWFRAGLDNLRTGASHALLAEDLDRVMRDPRDLEDLIDMCEATKATARSLSGSLTLTNGGTDAEITTARIMVAVANKASRDAARRMEDSRARRAAEGLFGGSGKRPFGYVLNGGGRLAVVEVEARLIRGAAHEVLSESFFATWDGYDGKRPAGGESLASLAASLREAGVTTTTGRPWTALGLRQMLLSPAIAGLVPVHHRDRAAGTHTLTLEKAGWKPIIDRDTWEAVGAKLRSPARRTTPGPAPRWLLSGIATCGVCGATVKCIGGGRQRKPAYVCGTRERCTRRAAAPTDAWAVAHVIERLCRPDVEDLLRPAPAPGIDRDALRARAEVLDAKGKQATRMWLAGSIPDSEYEEAARLRKQELDEIGSALAAPSGTPDPLAEFRGAGPDDVAQVWDGLTLARKRAVLRSLVTVRLLPARPARVFDPASVEITALG